MSALSIRKNDIVIVKQGKDKGKTGKVLVVMPDKGRAVVERINFVKEFIKPDRSKSKQGGIMEKEAPIPISRLMLYCEECGQGVRVRTTCHDDGSRTRICPKCENSLERQK
ncbi:MAG: 50S ribosomal protein L24 [Candidatus Aminicenantes bacterium]|nr:50S ribosomal protein L24 [Candidatus Aminicenantes bacterium]